MSDTQLDRRIRALVVEVVDATPPALPFESLQAAGVEPARARPGGLRGRVGGSCPRVALAVAVAAVSVVALALVAVWLPDRSSDPGEIVRPAGDAGGYEQPAGPATARLQVEALPVLRFQSEVFRVEAGIVQIDFVGRGGTHTLVFAELALDGFELVVSGDEIDRGKVELQPGEYTIYCDVPGHRAAGMEATVIVTPAPSSDEGE